jgi:hypothetical protein
MAIGLILALALLWPTEAAQRTIIEAYNHAATTGITTAKKCNSSLEFQHIIWSVATDEATDTKEEEQVLDVDNTKFLIDPSDCTSSNSSRLFFLVLVHSSAEHFDRREIIRKTWGSIQHFQGQAIKVLFLVGKQPNYNKAKSMRSPKMDVWERRDHEVRYTRTTIIRAHLLIHAVLMKAPSIVRESQIYGDIIQGDFLDITQNLSHKQMMGFKWVRDHCCHNTLPPVLVLKTDDDVFVEVFHLFKFAQAIYGGKPGSQSLICDVIPSGTAPRRSGRWEVRSKQHPDYCSGVAYLMTPDLAEPFLLTAQEVKRDLYIILIW